MAKEKDTEAKVKLQLIVFRQGDEQYALPIDQIKEVVITPKITKMPQTPAYIKGVANIRGNIIAVIDLAERFGLTQNGFTESTKNYTLVIESEEVKVGLLVKEVPNTLAVAESQIDDSLNIVHDTELDQNFITGIVKVDKRLIILLDIFKVITDTEKEVMAKVES